MFCDVARDFAAACGVANMDGILQVKCFDDGESVGSVMVHIVTVGDLSGAAMAAAVVSNDTIALGEEEQHLAIPIVRGERPSVVEDNWLGILRAPVLIKNVNAVFGGNDSHFLNSFSWFAEHDGAPINCMERRGASFIRVTRDRRQSRLRWRS